MEIRNERGLIGSIFLGPKYVTDEVRSESPAQVFAAPLQVPPTYGQFLGGSSSVSIEDALSLPAVYRAITILAIAVGQLSMTATKQGAVVAQSLVERPTKYGSQSAFMKTTVTHLATTGNAYWRLFRGVDGTVRDIEVLSPSRVLIKYDNNNVKTYDYTQANGKSVTLSNNVPFNNAGDVEHIRLNAFDGYVEGRGPIQVNNGALYAHLELRYYTDRFLRESKRPSGVYSFKRPLEADEREAAKAVLLNNRATGEPDVLGSEVTYQSVMFTPEEASLVELNRAAVTDVARMFGVPPHLLLAAVDGNTMTYQNINAAASEFARYGLAEYLTAIEDAMTNVIPNGQTAKFDVSNWLRGDESMRFENMAKADWLTVNEKREREGYAPVAGGNELSKPNTTEGDASSVTN